MLLIEKVVMARVLWQKHIDKGIYLLLNTKLKTLFSQGSCKYLQKLESLLKNAVFRRLKMRCIV